MRQHYVHRQGQVYAVQPSGSDRLMTPAEEKANLDAHRAGAANLSMGKLVARISQQAADQLEHAIGAAEHFNRVTERRVKSSTRVAVSEGDAA